MELPRPWIPLEQDDELDDWTEERVERRVDALRAQISQTEESLRTRTHRIATDMEEEGLAEKMDEALAGPDAPPDVVQETDAIRQQLDDMTIDDWRKGAEVAEQLKHLHDEASYGQAWLSACDYVRGLERDVLERLTHAIEQITAVAAQLTFLPQSVVVLALPSGRENLDLHYAREQTLAIGERLTSEKTGLTLKSHGGSNPSKDEPASALKAAFKVAQFAYYAGVLARYAGDALKQVLAHFHHALEHFLPMLSAVAKSIA